MPVSTFATAPHTKPETVASRLLESRFKNLDPPGHGLLAHTLQGPQPAQKLARKIPGEKSSSKGRSLPEPHTQATSQPKRAEACSVPALAAVREDAGLSL